ncbi:MAG: alcohol dehydrogenase catalytic domain-containing protein [Clostridiaceae bacterium]|jgi:L-iditol 2-dehydrogenase|nr:alcohol dehydrogenase catalytic domain-containing protein [Clostridiaceae bacterium]
MNAETSDGLCVNFYAPGDVRIEEMKEIPITGEGEVLVKVEACAICGTDVKSFLVGNPRIKPPQVMGHEFCGTIVEIGKGVDNYSIGQRVTMATTIGCGECIYCRKGRTNLCRSAEAMGFHYPGAMGPYIKIPAKAVRQGHLVDVGNLDAVVASLSEPMSCAMNDISRVPIEELKSVLIIGLGPLGLLHAVCLREKGVKNIICVEFPGKRTDMAKEMGFTTLVPDELDDNYKKFTESEGFDLVIVTAPHNASQGKAPAYARKGGYVSLFASLPVKDEMLSISSRTIHYNELILYGTSDSTVKHVEAAVELLRRNPERFKPLITHVMPMSDFHKAMDVIKAGDAVKIVLVP